MSVKVCCKFFLLKINRLFLIRDANFKMNQKKKIRRAQDFLHHFFAGETENQILKNNSNSNNFKENYWYNIFSFLCLLENKIFSKKRYFGHLHTKKKFCTCRDYRLTEYIKSFGQLYILENCLKTGRCVTELFVVRFSMKA
jgi:ribosomal protein L35